MKQQSLESKTYGFLLYVGIGILLANIYIFAIKNTESSGLNIGLIEILIGLIVIIFSIVSGFVAYKLNRSIIFWIIFSLALPPIALIVLSTKKRYLKPEMMKIFSQYESEYFLHKLKLRKDLDKNKITQFDYEEKLQETFEKLNSSMNIAMKEKEEQIIADLNKEVIQKVEKTGDGKVKIAYSKCPACGSALGKEDFECPDCGLNLK